MVVSRLLIGESNMSKRKQLEKELKIAEENYKVAFNFIVSIAKDFEEFESYMLPYEEEVNKIKSKLGEFCNK